MLKLHYFSMTSFSFCKINKNLLSLALAVQTVVLEVIMLTFSFLDKKMIEISRIPVHLELLNRS